MPFRQKLLADVPGGEPDVKIIFHGQLLLRSEDGATCEVGVNPLATGHVLSVEARTKAPGKPDLINMRHIGPLHFRRPEGMTIEVSPAVASPAAFKCVTLDPVNYETGEGAPDNDFRWILNLEGPLFHERELNPSIFGTQHVIKLQGGEFFFQTALRADSRLDYVRKGGGKTDLRLKRIGAIASASVFLAANQSVVLRWKDGTQEADRVLTLTKSAQGATYEIYVENTPLYTELDPSNPSVHDELIEYYKVIPEIPPMPMSARFRLEPSFPTFEGESAPGPSPAGSGEYRPSESGEGEPPEGEEGSPSIPCQVMTLDGP